MIPSIVTTRSVKLNSIRSVPEPNCFLFFALGFSRKVPFATHDFQNSRGPPRRRGFGISGYPLEVQYQRGSEKG